MTFLRLNRGQLLAMVAALALLLVMAMDWYTTKPGEVARDAASKVEPQVNVETVPSESKKLNTFAETQEKTAWQADGLIDRIILLALLAAVACALLAAWVAAAGKKVGPPSPSALASVLGLLACVLIVYRIIQPPGLNSAAVVTAGAPLGLLCAGLLAFGARVAVRDERLAVREEPAHLESPA
jgi:drug/metabolite transporter (DMT)-like permease